MTQLPPSILSHDHATPGDGRSLADRLHDGDEFAVTFGGQGADWFATLRDLVGESPDLARVSALVAESADLVAPVAELTHVVAEAAAPDELLDPYRAIGVTVTRA